jgi:hypothetical protein
LKLSKGLIIGIACGVAAIIAVAVILITTADPYKKAETAHFAEVLPVTSNMDFADGGSIAYNISFEPSDMVASMIGLPFTNIGVFGDLQYNSKSQYLGINISEDDESVAADIYNDFAANKVLLTLPGISEYAYEVETEETEELPEVDTVALIKTGTAISDKYFDIAKENGTYDTALLTNGGVDYKCDTFTLEFTGAMLDEFVVFAFDEIDKNESLTAYLEAALALDDRDWAEEKEEIISGANDTLGDDLTDEVLFKMTVYMKGGKILGREINEIYEFPDTAITLYDTKDKANRYQFVEYLDKSLSFTYTGDYTEKDGYLSGTADFVYSVDGEPLAGVAADVVDYKYTAKGGFIEGEIDAVISVGDYKINADAFFVKDGKTQIADFGMELDGDTPVDFGTISYVATYDAANPKITIPEFDDEHIFYSDDTSSDAAQAFAEDIYNAADSYDPDSAIYELLTMIAYEF